MAKHGRARERKTYKWMGGGLITLPSDSHIDAMSKGRLYATRAENVDYFRRGSVSKARGWTQKGDRVDAGSAYASQPINTDGYGSNRILVLVGSAVPRYLNIGQPFTTPATSKDIASITLDVFISNFTGTLKYSLWTEAAGSPVAKIAETRAMSVNTPAAVSIYGKYKLDFDTPPSLSAGTTYFVSADLYVTSQPYTSGTSMFSLNGKGNYPTPSTAKVNNRTEGEWHTPLSIFGNTSDIFFEIAATSPPVLGLWDMRFEDSGIFQYYGASCDGSLWAGDPDSVDAGGAWDDNLAVPSSTGPIFTGTASTSADLADMKMFKNYAFFCDNAQHGNRVWDGVDGSTRSPAATYGNPSRAESTMAHGYRPSFTGAAGAIVGGDAWSSIGYVSVLTITALKSGGYRAQWDEVQIANVGNTIDITFGVAGGATEDKGEFYFDIDANATTFYLTKPYQTSGEPGIYYKALGSKLTGGNNPPSNSTCAASAVVNISPHTDAQLEAEGDIEKNTTLPQGYFTLQVDTPQFRGMEVFMNMLAGFGDPLNPSRVWLAEQGAPQVWGTYGSTLGNYIDVAPEDGEVVTGIKVAGNALFVAKQHSLYRVDFTGDYNDPFRIDKVKGSLGTLSHFSMQTIPEGLYFLSEAGPACCYGTYSRLLPATNNIRNLFDRGFAERFNLSALQFAVSCNDRSRGLIYTTLSSTDASLRDQTLVYDYEQGQYFLMKDFNACVIAVIGDADSFPNVWYGDYQGVAYSQNGDSGDTTNEDRLMPMVLETPFLDMGDGSQKKSGSFLWLYADVPTADSTMSIEVELFKDDSNTMVQSFVIPATTTNECDLLRKGVARPIAPIFKTLKVRLRVPGIKNITISGFDIDYTMEGQEL